MQLSESFTEGIQSPFQLNAAHAHLSFLSLERLERLVGLGNLLVALLNLLLKPRVIFSRAANQIFHFCYFLTKSSVAALQLGESVDIRPLRLASGASQQKR